MRVFFVLLCAAVPALAQQRVLDDQGDPLPPGAVARLGTLRLRHAGAVTCVAYSPDGGLLASAAQDATIRLWDPATGKELRRLTGHKAGITTFVFSNAGTHIVSASGVHLEWFPDRSRTGSTDHFVIRLWDVATGRGLRSFKGHQSEITSLACSRDGNLIVSATTDGEVWIWDLDRDEPLHKLKPHSAWMETHVALSPDDRVLATAGGEDGHVKLFDLGTAKELRSWRASRDSIAAVAFTPDGSLIVTGDAHLYRRVKLWNAATGKLDRDLGQQHDNVSSFSFSRDGTRMVSGSVSHQTANVWDLQAKKLVRTQWTRLPVPSGFRWAALSPDGATMASAHGDNVVRLWDVASGAPKLDGGGHTSSVTAVAFHPKGALLATGDMHSPWRLWDVPTRREVDRCPDVNEASAALAFSPDGQLLASLRSFSTFRIRNADSKELISQGSVGRHFGLTFVPERGGAQPAPVRLAVGNWDKYAVDLHDPFSGRELTRFTLGNTGNVSAAAASPDGKLLAACMGRPSSAATHVIDLVGERPLFVLKHDFGGATSVAFAPDGSTLATAGEGNRGRTNPVYLWSMKDGAELARLAPEVHAQDPPLRGPRRQVAFSPDGKLLAVTGRDGVVRLFDAQTRSELRQFDGQQGGVWHIAFSPDGSLLATAGSDTTVLLWPLKKR